MEQIERMLLIQELEGLKLLVEVIETKHSAMQMEKARREGDPEEVPYERHKIQELYARLQDSIKELLFVNNRPIVSYPAELQEAQIQIMPQPAEDDHKDSEVTEIIYKWVGILIQWDIERALKADDISSVWTLLHEIPKAGLDVYLKASDNTQSILALLAEAACYSPEIMQSLLKVPPYEEHFSTASL